MTGDRYPPSPPGPQGPPRTPPPPAQRRVPPREVYEVEAIPEFEAYDEDEGAAEEISEEEYLREQRRLRRRRAATSIGSVVAGIIAAIIIFQLLSGNGLLPLDNFKPTPLEAQDLGVPSVPGFNPDLGDDPPTPSPGLQPAASYTVSWRSTDAYVVRGGAMRVNVTNKGGTQIYVDRVRMVPEWANPLDQFSTSFGRYVDPGEEVFIGLIGFTGPSSPGIYTYHFELDLLVQRPVLRTWASLPAQPSQDAELEVLPGEPVAAYPVYTNDKDIYREVNDLVEPDHPDVVAVADSVRQGLGEGYNLFWIASLFEWVLTELEYRSDPSKEDQWSPAGRTCSAKAGDCEDFSIVIASVVEHWGGNARFYIISKHAFAGVYVGGPGMDTNAVATALNDYYGTSLRYSWFRDDLGYWIIADGTSSQYLGGLPFNGVATDQQGGWDIEGTEYLYVTDIYPDYPDE